MKVMLLFPPSWTPSMPHLATPMLAAYLRQHGVEVTQHDLNVEVMDHILSREYLQRSLRAVRRRYVARRGDGGQGLAQPSQEMLNWALESGPMLIEEVEGAKEVFRGPAFWDVPRGRQALEVLFGSLQLASLVYYPTVMDLSSYSAPLPEDSSAAVLSLVRNPRLNIFYDILDRVLLDSLIDEGPDLIGISIPTMAQLVAGLTVAYLLRRRGCTAHITVGGPHITMLREQIARTPALFELFDSAVVFDGERPLLALAEAIADGRDLGSVPSLIYQHGDTIRVTEPAEPIPMDDLPTPDFAGLSLQRYLIPEPVLPLIGSRGCYHGQCAFCSVGYGGPRGYRQMSPERVVEHMLRLVQATGTRHIWFADEAISPRNLRGMARLLQQEGSPVHWAAYGRMERAITADLLGSVSRAGCRMLFYGLETASPRIIERMGKGTTTEEMSRVLRQGAAVGIWNHVFFFFGFPGETMADAQETVDFLYAHQDCIHSAAFGTFMLERHSPVHANPGKYGVTKVMESREHDLAVVFDYCVAEGLDEATAEQVATRLLDVLPQKEEPHFYVHDTYRLLYATRLYEQGQRFPTWLGD